MIVIGCVLGGLKLSAIWGLFGAANQLLAGLALTAVCAWLGEVGKNNKMFYFPMAFMLVATLTYLIMKISKLSSSIISGSAVWGDWFQIFFAIAMVILAVFLVGEAVNTFKKQKAARKAKA